jgi:hypothetical protein
VRDELTSFTVHHVSTTMRRDLKRQRIIHRRYLEVAARGKLSFCLHLGFLDAEGVVVVVSKNSIII